jgi:hypothetical protein
VADKTPFLVDIRNRTGSPLPVDKVTLTASAGVIEKTTAPFSFDLLAAGPASLKVEKANHHTYEFALNVRETGSFFTVDFSKPDMIDAPKMADLVKAGARTGTIVAEKNVLTLRIGVVHEVVLVSGFDYRPHTNNPGSTGHTKYRAFATQRMHDLYANGLIDDSTVISFFEMETAELTRWVKGRGKERLSDFRFTSGWSRLSLDAGTLPIIPKTAPGYPGARSGIKTINDVYAHIQQIGEFRPGALIELSFFSHSDRPGPALFNTFEDDDHKRDGIHELERDEDDTDGRFWKDFNDVNMPPPKRAHFVAAFSSSPFVRVWGCLEDQEVRDMVQAAARATNDAQALGATVRVRTLWFAPHTLFPDTRPGAIETLRRSLFAGSYMARLARVIGRPVFGAGPGMGSNIHNTAFGLRFYVPEFRIRIENGNEIRGAPVYKGEMDFMRSRLGWTFDERGYMRFDPPP